MKRVQPTASSATIQAQVAPSLGAPVFSRTIGRHLAEKTFVITTPFTSRGVRLNAVFALKWHTTATAAVMVWSSISYNTRSPLVLILGTLKALWYAHDILQPLMLPLMQRLPGSTFQQDNARPHTARVSQDCLLTVTTPPLPARFPDLSPIKHIWVNLGMRVGHSTSLNELDARLQQIQSKMS
ncbi:transposable element Tcb1 transposase [Trichonephila clavipes]|uniref:Transposable element Tcb1 transposase n=1 Tax=Trichonephila clavipes TaxID=2585209 RepID=A0A8X6SCU6_TRICX|nr:transposable element Tcb1 transposase [Trichonephila clavipes]